MNFEKALETINNIDLLAHEEDVLKNMLTQTTCKEALDCIRSQLTNDFESNRDGGKTGFICNMAPDFASGWMMSKRAVIAYAKAALKAVNVINERVAMFGGSDKYIERKTKIDAEVAATENNTTPITKDNAQQLLINGGGDYNWHMLATQYDLYVDLNEITPLADVLKNRCDMPDDLAMVFNPDLESEWAENVNYFNSNERLLVKIDGVFYEVFEDNKRNIHAVHVDAIYCQHDGNNEPLETPYFSAPLAVLLAD